MAKIGVFVQTEYAKSAYKNDSFDKRVFPGMIMVCKELEKNNIEYEFCSSANAHKYRILLVSITSQCDWSLFVAERVTWKKGNYSVIVGGFGVTNPRVLLEYADYFYLGRSENDIAKMCQEIIDGEYIDRDHVIESKKYSIEKQYKIRSVNSPYIGNYGIGAATICESVVGCQRKCLFCSFSWHRKYVGGGLQKDSGIFAGDSEKTMFEILKGDYSNLSSLRMVGLDGVSERVRKIVNKPITQQNVVDLAVILSKHSKPHHVKLYNIVGYGFENESDYEEFAETIIKCDEAMKNGKFAFEIHSTPFRPMPATPMALQPTKYFNWRGEIAKKLRKYTSYSSSNSVFYNGKNLFALETMGTEGLSTVAIDMIILRGTEQDAENYKKMCVNKKFWSADSNTKIATIEKYFDVEKLFGRYTINELPTKNIHTYCKIDYDYFEKLIQEKSNAQ